jgi:hypothetical protein
VVLLGFISFFGVAMKLSHQIFRSTICLAALLTSSMAFSGPREVADRIAQRLNGVPPSKALLDQMTALVEQGKSKEAALLAIDNATDPAHFYNLTLMDWTAPFTNEEINNRVGLNDYIATIIGMVRDDKPFDQILYGNYLYIGQAGTGNALAPANLAPYAITNNTHYENLEAARTDLKASLIERPQSELNGFPESAGILSSYGFGRAFYDAGTNRAATRFAVMTFLCHDQEQMMDTTRTTRYIRQDVGRTPGGSAQAFKTKCQGCHSGMDSVSGAFAFWNFDAETGALQHTPGQVHPKFLQNSETFPQGYVTTADTWINLWSEGTNAKMGWKGDQTGKGINSFGRLLASTDEFNRCMAKRVYARACIKSYDLVNDPKLISELADGFKSSGFKMKNLWAEAVLKCPAE